MKITHIFHSGFMVEMEKCVLLFDWYTGTLPQIPDGKRLYVFCSHAHEDHYSPAIWKLQRRCKEVSYILDRGIPDAAEHPEAEVTAVAPHQTCRVHEIRIRTLASTDMGVAFYVEVEGRRIYHAGDLNVWFWYDEPMEDNLASEKRCREEMQDLADAIRRKEKGPLLDIAFVPLDPRLREEAPRCMAAFIEILDAGHIFPMHYWEREEETRAYLQDPGLSPYIEKIHFEKEMELP